MVKVTPLLLPNLSLLLSLVSNFKSNRYPGTKEADETWCHDHDPSNQPELAFLRIGKAEPPCQAWWWAFCCYHRLRCSKTRQQKQKGSPEGGTPGGVRLRSTFLPVPGTGPAGPTGGVPGAQPHGTRFDPGLLSCVSLPWPSLGLRDLRFVMVILVVNLNGSEINNR